MRVPVSKSLLLQKTTITSELAVYTLEMSSFDDGDLDILTPGLFHTSINLSPKRVAPPMTIVIGLEKNKPAIHNKPDLSPALSAVERGLAS